MCLRSLLKRKSRTSLSILGVALSVILVTGVGLTTVNYMSAIKGMNTFYQGTVVVISRGSVFIQVIPIGSVFLENTADAIEEQIEGVKSAIPMLATLDAAGTVTFPPLNITLGIPEGNWSVLVGSTPLKSGGRWPESTDPDVTEVVIGSYLAESNSLEVGSEIKIKNRGLTVVGILDSPSALLSRAIIMPLKVAQEVYRYPKMINLVIVEPDEGTTCNEIDSRIESEFPSLNALMEDERENFVDSLFQDIVKWNMGLSAVLLSISSLLVSSISFMDISERKKEIATLYAVGAPKGFVVRILTLETTLIGVIGSLIGVVLGVVVAILMFCFYGSIPVLFMLQNIHEIAAPIMILEILGGAVALCFIGGLIPALVTTRKNIAENLRTGY